MKSELFLKNTLFLIKTQKSDSFELVKEQNPEFAKGFEYALEYVLKDKLQIIQGGNKMDTYKLISEATESLTALLRELKTQEHILGYKVLVKVEIDKENGLEIERIKGE